MSANTDFARRPVAIGIDIGGVLVDRVAEGDDTSFFGFRPMDTPMVPGSLEAVRELLEMFDDRVYIVSKAGPKVAALSRQWLGVRGFVAGSGSAISPANVHFVRKRPEKHPICERLDITHFIDDRLDVHEHLVTVEQTILFTGGLGKHPAPERVPVGITIADTWPKAVEAIRTDLRRRHRGTVLDKPCFR